MHIPVLADKVVEFLEPLEGKVILDATVGGGGHAEAILRRLGPQGRLIGLDQDSETLKFAKERLSSFHDRVSLMEKSFAEMKEALQQLGVSSVDGIVMDLGISSLQLNDATRGFSFQAEGPLDMRMDRRRRLTAGDLVNTLDEQKLWGLLREYGEERYARRIAAAIVHFRKKSRISTTQDLAEIVERTVRRKGKIHPATRTFQALRIAVNGELDSLKVGLKQAVDLLSVGGKCLVLSYHSLEDRIVKHFFKSCGRDKWNVVTRKPVLPSDVEIKANPRARSAKLRVLERVA